MDGSHLVIGAPLTPQIYQLTMIIIRKKNLFDKKILLILIGLIFYSKINAAKIEGTIIFRNDSVSQVIFDIPIIFWLGEINYISLQELIIYKDSEKNKFRLTPDEVKEIIFRYNDEEIRMISVENVPYKFPFNNPPRHILLRLIIDGNLSLFIFHNKVGPVGMYVGPGSKWRGYSNDVELIVLKKNGGELFKPSFTKSFKSDMKLYLSDCPSLIEKIENDIYNIDNIRQIVTDYNTNCATKNNH